MKLNGKFGVSFDMFEDACNFFKWRNFSLSHCYT